MRLTTAMILACVSSVLLCPTQSLARTAPAFAAEALSNSQLSSIRGTARSGFFAQVGRSMTDSEAMTAFRTSADVNRLTFDNWFTDVGNPLIFSNIAQQSAMR